MYHIAGYCSYISRISRNQNVRKDWTSKVATLGMWVWFSIIPRIAAISKLEKYTPLENNPLYGVFMWCGVYRARSKNNSQLPLENYYYLTKQGVIGVQNIIINYIHVGRAQPIGVNSLTGPTYTPSQWNTKKTIIHCVHQKSKMSDNVKLMRKVST